MTRGGDSRIAIGQLVPLTVEKPAAGGAMIARLDGRVVFVSGAIPGERVTARIVRVRSGTVFAETLSVEDASPDRRAPFCDPACGGTAYAHIAYHRQLAIKADVIADGLRRIGHLTPPEGLAVAASPDDGYRMRARLHARDGHFGFVREGTHQICDVRATKQLLPETCDVLERIGDAARTLGLRAIHELDLSENIEASARVVHLRTSSTLDRTRIGEDLFVPGLTGLTVTDVQSPGAVPETHLAAGDPYVFDRFEVGGEAVVLRRHVQAFFQGNRYLLRDVVAHVVALVPPGGRIVDLYAGVGLFAMTLARAGAASVVAVEGDSTSARDLEVNASPARHVTVRHQSVEEFLGHRHPAPDTVVLDPPRTGLSERALGGLIALAAPCLVYVSCDVATLARDARGLVGAGYRMERLDAFDLFPNTPHVETVAVFRR